MNNFLGLANETLFLTNLFIYAYKILLKLLNRLFPPVVNPNFFSKELFSPEPFEIPLYIILTIIFVIIILSKFINFFTLRTSPKRGIIFLVLLLAFYINIGSYPLKDDTQFIQSPVNITTSILILAAYLAIITIIIAAGYSLRRRRFLLFLLLTVAIGLFTFEPGFPSSNHDASYFFGPIYEIAHGKTIFTETSSQYGFLSILILAFLARLQIFNPFYLPFLRTIILST